MLESRVVETLAAVDRQAWDALFPHEVERYDYLAAVEAAGLEGFGFRYVLVEKDGRLVAAAPAFITRYALETTVDGAARSFLRGLGKIAPGLVALRLACLGSPCTETAQLGLAPEMRTGPERDALVRTLMSALEEAARRDRCGLVAVKDIPVPQADAWDAALERLGYHGVTGLPLADLAIDFPDIDAYVARLSPATRKDMRRKLRASASVRTEVRRDLTGLEDQVMALYAETHARGDLQFETLTPAYFTGVLARMGKRAACVLYVVDDRLLAANLVLIDQGILLDKFFCMAEAGRAHNLYFLSWFTNIGLCLDLGLTRYQSGQAAYANKLRLGSRLTPVTMRFRHRNRLVDAVLRLASPLLAPDVPEASAPPPPAPSPAPPTLRARWARRLLFLALPLLGLAYQISAKKTAEAMTGVSFGLGWLLKALVLPWGQALIAMEILAFAVWMVVLSEIKLSEAFPLSALSYALVVVASWTVFHEPASLLQALGGAAILLGVWLMGRSSEAKQ
jgi:predicted N-acyltransferase/multidrug transporter EmrE-like cation transporter